MRILKQLSEIMVLIALATGLAAPVCAQSATALSRAAPIDQNTPASLLKGFLAASGPVADAVVRQDNGGALSDAQEDAASDYLAVASSALDFSEVAPVLVEQWKLEQTLLLFETLRRVPRDVLRAGPQKIGEGVWVVPGTPLTIERVADGDGKAGFLFSSASVAQMHDIYARAVEQPPLWGSNRNAYEVFSDTPGKLVTPEWYALVRSLPGFLRQEVGGQQLWQWLGLLFIGISAIALPIGAWRLAHLLKPDSAWVVLLQAAILPLSIRITAFTSITLIDELNIVDSIYVACDYALMIVGYTVWAWFIWIVAAWLSDQVPPYLKRHQGIPVSLAKMLIQIVGIVVMALVLGQGLTNIGVPLVGILAGLGVGGLAVALAAQPTIENLISGIILYVDKPVRVGDECVFEDMSGTVVEIGIRSTRVRLNDGTLVTIPNAAFANMTIRNIAIGKPHFGYKFPLSNTLEPNLIQTLLAEIRQHLVASPLVDPSTVEVIVDDVDTDAITIEAWGSFAAMTEDYDDARGTLQIGLLTAISSNGAQLAGIWPGNAG